MDLTNEQQGKIDQIGKKHDLKMMVIYGSQVNGKTHSASDLDIGILLHQNPESFHALLDVQDDLKNIFSDFKMDVRYLNNTSPYFRFEAIYKGKLIYGSNYDYVKLCAKVFKEYVDTKYLRDLRDDLIQKRQLKFLN